MAGTAVVFHRLAAREFRDSRDWYSIRSHDAAQRFVEQVDRAIERVSDNPEGLPCLAGEYRYVRVSGFPFIIVFRRIAPDTVKVIAVAHTSRRPRYWRHRR